MNRWLWELRRAQWRLGTYGLIAMLLIGGAMVIALAEIVPLRRDIAAREADLDARAARLTQPPPPSPDQAVAPESPEQRYFVFLHSLHAIAAKNGVTIPQITYQLAAPDKDSSLRRYVVDTTFTSHYLQLRGFLFELRTLPGVRCERLTVSRPNIGVTDLEVRLQCAFLVEASK
ncbi:hypothetical protein BVER_01387 [Candidatus Burkholderia verschuerenii]|uniref:Uncharacterized protein n=1 Tax=Candidatus Burkholderia verschuerenii TaxID=242163 RepID=A0A0L0M9W9_9BURK|nr:hypothetical protein [Candidatus Burkholderia verschuerenii]KND59507.1 hypothetical protein BVER_01387 [Candidatus Burkholderia verschuerenii]